MVVVFPAVGTLALLAAATDADVSICRCKEVGDYRRSVMMRSYSFTNDAAVVVVDWVVCCRSSYILQLTAGDAIVANCCCCAMRIRNTWATLQDSSRKNANTIELLDAIAPEVYAYLLWTNILDKDADVCLSRESDN